MGYDYRVRVALGVEVRLRPGADAWVVGVFEKRPESAYFERFPPGVVYTIEYEDGESTDVHESQLQSID